MMRRLLVRVGIAVVASLFVALVGLVGPMFLEGVLLEAQEMPASTVCTLVGEPMK